MPDSKSEEVGDVALAAVRALAVPKPDGTGPVPAVKRKMPSWPEQDRGKLPQFVISVGEEGATEYLTARKKLRRFPVAVTVVTGGGMKMGDDPLVRKWRDQIETMLEARATWADLAGFNEVNVTNGEPFDAGALSKDLNYSTVVAEVQVIEVRT